MSCKEAAESAQAFAMVQALKAVQLAAPSAEVREVQMSLEIGRWYTSASKDPQRFQAGLVGPHACSGQD